jgi:alpha-L-fucosidase
VRPWVITHEKDIWFTRKKNSATVYAIVDRDREWAFGEWQELVLKSVRATGRTQVSVLGQNDKVLEYRPAVVPKTTWRQESDGLHVRAMRTQRLRDNHHWPDPLVLKLSDVEASFVPPRAETVKAAWERGAVVFEGRLDSLGDSESLEVGFAYHAVNEKEAHERVDDWIFTPSVRLRSAGNFSAVAKGLTPGRSYEVRVVVKHPLSNFYGREVGFEVP